MNDLEQDPTIQRRQDLLISEMDDEAVMFDIQNGQYIGLNSVANRIWNLIEMPTRLQAICEKLQQEYDVEQEACQRQVRSFVNSLLEKHLAEVVVG